jgi:hypothetical protein
MTQNEMQCAPIELAFALQYCIRYFQWADCLECKLYNE